MNALRHRRTVSSRTPNASAIRALVHPRTVRRIALALSARTRRTIGRRPRDGLARGLLDGGKGLRAAKEAAPARLSAGRRRAGRKSIGLDAIFPGLVTVSPMLTVKSRVSATTWWTRRRAMGQLRKPLRHARPAAPFI